MTLLRTYIDGPFGQLHLRYVTPAHAAAVPVLCLHPNPLSGRIFEPLLADLGRDRLAVAVDTPGFGNSAPPSAQPTLQEYASAARAVAAHFGLAQVDLIGAQTGARMSVALAEQAPDLVRRLVLIHAPVWTPAEREAGQKNYKATRIERDGAHLLAEWQSLRDQLPPGADLTRLSDLFADSMLGLDRDHRTWTVRANAGYVYEDVLPHLAKPILVLNPQGWLHALTARIAPLLRNGRVVDVQYTLPEALLLQPATVAALIRPFLDES